MKTVHATPVTRECIFTDDKIINGAKLFVKGCMTTSTYTVDHAEKFLFQPFCMHTMFGVVFSYKYLNLPGKRLYSFFHLIHLLYRIESYQILYGQGLIRFYKG